MPALAISACVAAAPIAWTSSACAQGKSRLAGVLQVERDRSGCVTEAALRARVDHWLQPSVIVTGVSLTVHTGSRPLAFTVRRGGRALALRKFDLKHSSCADRLDALGLAMALAIEHVTAEGTSKASANRAPARAKRTLQTRQTIRVTRHERATERARVRARLSGRLALTASVDRPTRTPSFEVAEGPLLEPEPMQLRVQLGAVYLLEALPDPLPTLVTGFELFVSERFSFSLSGLASPESQFELGSGVSHVELVAGRALVCSRWQWPAAIQFESCAGGIAGMVSVKGSGYAISNRESSVGWAAGLAGAGLRYPDSGRVGVRASVHALFNVMRPKLWVQTAREQHTAQGDLLGLMTSLEFLVQLS